MHGDCQWQHYKTKVDCKVLYLGCQLNTCEKIKLRQNLKFVYTLNHIVVALNKTAYVQVVTSIGCFQTMNKIQEGQNST